MMTSKREISKKLQFRYKSGRKEEKYRKVYKLRVKFN